MTKKKKVHNEEPKQNIINDIIDNKDIRSQYNAGFEDNNGVDAEKSNGQEEITDSLKRENENGLSSDKEVNHLIAAMEKLAEMQDR
jgi:hypothetical protein